MIYLTKHDLPNEMVSGKQNEKQTGEGKGRMQMNVQEMKKAACAVIDRHAEELIALNDSIYREPELGYKEFKTAAKMKEQLDRLGLKYEDGVAITGIITPLSGRSHGINVAVMGELDAVLVPGHKYADPLTGAAHCCGHCAQAASVIGVAAALVESGVMQYLDGDVTLMHVPSEEFVELEYRENLIQQGKIKLLGGKQEFIRLGKFDAVDIVLTQHTLGTEVDAAPEGQKETKQIQIKANCGGAIGKGFVGKMIHYTGKASHAALPSEGINALTAARLGFAGMDALRETFRDEDGIRVHPIITKGGNLVNVIPADVRIETYVRGQNMPAILDASEKVDRAFKAGGYVIGAKCEITQIPGYMCPYESQELKDLGFENLKEIFGADHCERDGIGASTDTYDVANLLPTLAFHTGGAKGTFHGVDFDIVRLDYAVLDAAKVMVCTLIDLLANGAEKAQFVKERFQPALSKEQYLHDWCRL